MTLDGVQRRRDQSGVYSRRRSRFGFEAERTPARVARRPLPPRPAPPVPPPRLLNVNRGDAEVRL